VFRPFTLLGGVFLSSVESEQTTQMPVMVKIEYVDEVAVIKGATRAEEKQGSLFVYDKDGAVVAKFNLAKVEHWWTGSSKKPENF
jgi:hypothetical protein